MDYIQHSSHVDDAEGKYQFGETPPTKTVVTAQFLNGVQNELMHIIEEAGITPDAADNTQVLEAIRKIGAITSVDTSPPGPAAVSSGATVQVQKIAAVRTGDLVRATYVLGVTPAQGEDAVTATLAPPIGSAWSFISGSVAYQNSWHALLSAITAVPMNDGVDGVSSGAGFTASMFVGRSFASSSASVYVEAFYQVIAE